MRLSQDGFLVISFIFSIRFCLFSFVFAAYFAVSEKKNVFVERNNFTLVSTVLFFFCGINLI